MNITEWALEWGADPPRRHYQDGQRTSPTHPRRGSLGLSPPAHRPRCSWGRPPRFVQSADNPGGARCR